MLNDLDLARHRRQIETLEDEAEYRAELALYREVLDHQQAKGGWPEKVHLGGGFARRRRRKRKVTTWSG